MKSRTKIFVSFVTCVLISTGFSFCTSKPIHTYENKIISFDTLKSKFEKGDIIIINKLVLLGPKDFFDSVSIDKNSFKGILVSKNSSTNRFGSLGASKNFYEIEIESLDSLPQGDFIDEKAFRYLNPNEEVFYFINGSPCNSHLQALDKLRNKRIKEIQKLESFSAVKIWGNNIGKDGAVIVNTDEASDVQEIFRPFNPKSIGRSIIRIDSLQFYNNKVSFERIDELTKIKKQKGVITIPTTHSFIQFRDITDYNNPIEFKILGQKGKNNWILIKGEDELQDYYYLINKNLNKTDTLVGNPMIFGDKLLCQEGSYTDGTDFIEIWNSKNGKLELIKKFSLRNYNITVNELFLKNNMLFIRFNMNKYMKMRY